MISMLGSPKRCCDGVTRREALRAGAMTLGAGLGLGLPEFLRAEEASGSNRGKARSVIVLYLLGGAATQDMVDMKPEAPSGVRGEFRPIATSVPGLEVCEHLPLTARWAHRLAVVRSMTHSAGCHNPLPSYTGWEVIPPDIVSTSETYPPSMGSVVESLRKEERALPDYVYIPNYLGWGQSIRRPGPYAGFLGKRFDPLCSECDPHLDDGTPEERPWYPQVLRGVPSIPNATTAEGITLDRLDRRRGLLQQFEGQLRHNQMQVSYDQYDRSQRRAFDLLTSEQARRTFDLSDVDPIRVDRYGRTLFGNSALIASKLVEAGVRFVNVTWDLYWERLRLQHDGWDTHGRNFAILKDYNLPFFDLAFSALLEDLEARGLLDETLVVVMSEMGRTPKINGNAGRDHWTYCYSVTLAGAGIQGGTVYGASDSQAAFVKDLPVRPADLCATIYHCLGIDPEMTVADRTGRPVPIAQGGRPITGILA
ncbi:DUF1501 domain-containing protein [Tautonia rosea]|uniref:DUF1501 domain-containing protein n=1 Tax=Tautonia rosea TaxID=2728037 RepID=UPI001474DF8A|nr:DUF1501 domain-containing protein [Tautonia rosea]